MTFYDAHGQSASLAAHQPGMATIEGLPLLPPSHLPYSDPQGQPFQPMLMNSGHGNKTMSASLDSVPMGLSPPSIVSHPEYGAVTSYMPDSPALFSKPRTLSGHSRPLHHRTQSAGGQITMPRHHRTRTSSITSASSIASSGIMSSITTSLGATNISFSDSPISISTATGDSSSMVTSTFGSGQDMQESSFSPYSPTSQKSRQGGHARKAVAARVFECTIPGCSKAYTQLHNLKSHERTGHTPTQKPKPFHCIISECNKAFSQRKSLALHIRASHKEYKFKPFKCSQPSCQKSYTQLHNLRTHEKTVHLLDLSRKRIRNPTPNNGNGGVSMTGSTGNDGDNGGSGSQSQQSNQNVGQASLSGGHNNQMGQRNQITPGSGLSYCGVDGLNSYDVGMYDENEGEGEEAEDEDENDDDYVDEYSNSSSIFPYQPHLAKMSSIARDIQDIELLRHYHLDKTNPDAWVDEEDLPSWVHDDDANTDHGGKLTPRERKGQYIDDDSTTISEQTDLLGLVKGNILKSKNVRGDTNLISSTQKSFNPQRYLYAVHADTPYDDLCVGVDRLQASIAQRSSALKVLVQNNFDRFVSAKNVIDSVYDDMKEKTLNEAQDWGTNRLNSILRESYGKAHEVINPVLERREKVEKLRSTVGLLEPYRLFFNLPNTLQESIKQGKYQQAARDYNKGKVLLAQAFPTSSGPSASDNASINSHSSSNLIETKRRVFDRVWSEVERIVARLRADLESQLEEPWRGMEEHERNIKLLFELDTTTDPVWHCLSSQYRWIKKIMAESYDEQITLVEELRKSEDYLQSQNMTASGRTGLFKQILGAMNSSEFENMFAKEPEVKVWLAISAGVKTLSELMLRLLPDFWKLATAYMEGKIQKVQSQKRRTGVNVVDPQRVTQCHAMVKDIVDLYSTQMSFMLVENLVTEKQQSGQQSEDQEEEHSASPRESSVVTAFFLGKIVTEVSNCVNDVNGLSLRGGAFMVLVDMMQRIRWKFVEVICDTWGEDAKVFYKHEDWTLQTENSQITLFVGLFYQFHECCLRSAYKYASIWTATTEDSVHNDEASAVVPMQYTEKIRKTFLDALYSFLDGLVHLAFADAERSNRQQQNHDGAGSLENLQIGKKSKVIDITELDSRILITISNLSELRSVTIPKLLKDFERICGVSMSEDGKTLIEVVDQLDSILFDDYIKRKTVVASRVITDGILYWGIDWYSIPKPTGVHAFMIEALLSLVVVHAQISEIAPPLVFRALSALLINMAQDCLRCFQQIERFGMGGMLHATLEMEFMNQTLSQYRSPSSDEILQMVYGAIDRAYQPEGGDNLQNEMGVLKKLLADARQSTQVQFMCFKKPKQ
ncbi:hypothetical protein BGX27_009007 [Mortierella sp. AM989]|nr:hypothetical protein BGX27_009007 [Mortierella sp. AM989]